MCCYRCYSFSVICATAYLFINILLCCCSRQTRARTNVHATHMHTTHAHTKHTTHTRMICRFASGPNPTDPTSSFRKKKNSSPDLNNFFELKLEVCTGVHVRWWCGTCGGVRVVVGTVGATTLRLLKIRVFFMDFVRISRVMLVIICFPWWVVAHYSACVLP